MAIPSVLNQIFFREDDPMALPPKSISNAIAELMGNNPGWVHRLYDLKAMRRWILDNNGQAMLSRFDSIAPGYGAAKADLFRYLLIQREGGLYLDIKFKVTGALDAITSSGSYLLPQWDNDIGGSHEGWGCHPQLSEIAGGEYVQGIIAAPPGSPFLDAVVGEVVKRIDNYDPVRDGAGRAAVLLTTGPIAYSIAIEPLRTILPHRLVKPFQLLGLEYPLADHDRQREQLFSNSYVYNWRPLIIRPATLGVMQRERARLAYFVDQASRVRNIPRRIKRMRYRN